MLAHGSLALAADAEEDALSLSSAPVQAADEARKTRIFVEGALGVGDPRFGSGTRTLRRVSVDLTHVAAIAPGWRAVLSDRLDYMRPSDLGDDAINSLREAYVSWQHAGAGAVVDVGRVNLRYGPAYGYNPTDFFRDGALRTITSLDPITLRENRLGTVVVRGQALWSNGSASLAFSPKLDDRASRDGWSLDLGATNNRDRGLFVLAGRLSERLSGQLLLYQERDLRTQVGASLTALVTDSVVAYAEASRGREPDLLNRTQGTSSDKTTENRLATGLTYTTPSKLSLTAEYEYNGFAMKPSEFDELGRNFPALQRAYVIQAVRSQELASRRAWLLYATQRGIGLRNLDLTALLRVNGGDHSRLVWIELRHHWDRFDLALRLQQQSGRDGTEYSYVTDRRSAQLVGTYYF